MSRKPKPLNERQLKVAKNYAGGEYAHHTMWDDTQEAGDSLYEYAISEAEDADSDEEYVRRLETAIDDLEQLKVAFETP